jgi:hypothetical protein
MDRYRENDMKIRVTILTLCAMLFALCSSAEAQQPKKVPRIGPARFPFVMAIMGCDPVKLGRVNSFSRPG